MAQFYIGSNNLEGGNAPRNPFSSLVSLLVVVGFLVLLGFIFYGFIKILYFVAPALLILALIINRKIVFNYANRLVTNFKTDILRGIIWVLFLIFAYPFVFFWLLIKAILMNKFKKIMGDQIHFFEEKNQQQNKGRARRKPKNDEWTDYEEIK